MRTSLRPAVLVAFFIGSAFGQSLVGVSLTSVTAPPHPAWMTDAVVFEFLFKHVAFVEAHANELKATGKDDSFQRHRFKNIAQLTDAEEAVLKRIASDEESAMAAFHGNEKSVVGALRAQYPTKSLLPPSGLQQLQALTAQKQQIIQTHMANLQADMAPDRFQKFYNFAWGTEGPRIRLANPGARPPTAVKPPSTKQ